MAKVSHTEADTYEVVFDRIDVQRLFCLMGFMDLPLDDVVKDIIERGLIELIGNLPEKVSTNVLEGKN